MEWWLWLTIFGSVLVVGVVLYLLLAGDEEQEEQQMEEKLEGGDKQRTYDLDDPEVLKALRADGLDVHVGRPTHLTVADAGPEKYYWSIQSEPCDGIV